MTEKIISKRFSYIFVLFLLQIYSIKTATLVGNVLLRSYPCNGTTSILEVFETNQPPEDENKYDLFINVYENGFNNFPVNSKINLVFDSHEMNLTLKSDYGRIQNKGPGKFLITTHTKKNDFLDMVVRGRQGTPVPNVLSIIVNGDDLCANGVRKGDWDPHIVGSEFSASSASETKPKDDIPFCGRRQVFHSPLITQGYKSKPGDWPWHAAIYRRNSQSASQSYTCGGTLISPSKVVTAGHCVTESKSVIIPDRLLVVLGKFKFEPVDSDVQNRKVYSIILHPEFDFASLKNDIAITVLSAVVEYGQFVQPVCLWPSRDISKSSITHREPGHVVGWGFIGDRVFASELTEARMPVVTKLDCIISKPDFYSRFLHKNAFCAGFNNGTSACNGDSGGGMFFPEPSADGQQTWYFRGIVSLSYSVPGSVTCDPNNYVIFTDAANYLNWMTNKTDEL